MLNLQLKRKRTFAQSVLFVVFLLSSTLAFAQNKVTGTVTDKSGEPLAGVNVLEKGTTNGCITDLDGKYSIEVKRGQTLIFTFIGFTKKEVQVNQSAINVVMEEDSQTLDEVVVVGYGSITQHVNALYIFRGDKCEVYTWHTVYHIIRFHGSTIT